MPIPTLKSHHVRIILTKTGTGYPSARNGIHGIGKNAITIKIVVSRNCDQRLERLERSQKPAFANRSLKKKKESTSWYSATINAISEAMAILPDMPNTVS